jgi:hypothetical protein
MPYYTSTWSAPTPTKECAPNPCPTCGGLECLCRPRFFAGQLLTEEDLNRLEHYIIEKNKLHNRYLHGWGVACGLEVICSPCAGQVTVTSGYALSPCGEDILVCKDDTVNVCDLIRQCKNNQRRQLDCEPPNFGSGNDCKDVPEDWILAIRYDEKPSRGITALRGSTSSSCCSRCSCGGSSSCGCSCHTQTNGTMKNGSKSPQRTLSAQCEPTVTCEGYVYEVYKAPATNLFKGRNIDRGPLVARFNACLEGLQAVALPCPDANASPQQMQMWCCSLKAGLQDFLTAHETTDCQLVEKLAAYKCPVPAQNQTAKDYCSFVYQQLNSIALEYLLYCFCSALLPPCPEPVDDPRVPLATITVRKDNCQILRVCDWDTRKIAITLPTLEYWLSILPYWQKLRECLTLLCCNPFELLGTGPRTTETGFLNIGDIFTSLAQSDPFATILSLLANCVFGQPLAARALDIRAILSSALSAGTAGGATGGGTEATTSSNEEINNLKSQLADLEKTMQTLQTQIDALLKK